MQFRYKARSGEGEPNEGVIDAASLDLAVSSLQRRNFLVISIEPIEGAASFGAGAGKIAEWLGVFETIPMEDIVILTRQLSTLFEARVPVVESLKIIIGETENRKLRRHISDLLDDIQGGMPMSGAMARHPEVFSRFYVAMIKSGEESGKLEDIFKFLADYLERSYELSRKARNALIYPAFVLSTFIIVMAMMLVFVVPNLANILTESGQAIPIYTRIIIGLSDFLRSFGIILILLLAVLTVLLARYAKTENGRLYFSRLAISMPIIGGLYKKIYLSRISDNLHTLLSGGITVVRALEITSEVVGNEVYRKILLDSMDSVKSGSMISESLSKYADIPPLLSQMIRIGEETGKLDYILKSVAGFYRRDVDNFIDNLVSLIEPILIVGLGLGVGVLVAAVLVPIYNISTTF
ncbi:MAG: type II secretion system F family protein [Candidatus Giovannonibacteria bacterium]|nr:type II secretion system F family protein [Candidatus Giovannonibacteria bacterium]